MSCMPGGVARGRDRRVKTRGSIWHQPIGLQRCQSERREGLSDLIGRGAAWRAFFSRRSPAARVWLPLANAALLSHAERDVEYNSISDATCHLGRRRTPALSLIRIQTFSHGLGLLPTQEPRAVQRLRLSVAGRQAASHPALRMSQR